ncbi:MAG: trypsin-like peptidase domain-containing protein, partial [Rhodospirillaceae bacterium]|nr:trypsin-like peptidase domain-containing protein [Rhodospirillaceae bacterium]
FYVSDAGHIVTAAHVVKGCKTYRTQALGDAPGPAVVVARSESDDLALLKSETKRAPAPLRIGTLRLGEQIVLFGFPLPGALASSGNLTTGNIAALAGIKDDHRMMQISAPAQPGNSGGPVVDLRGRVVGVVVHSLSTLRAARAIGSLPQNLNFAVKASVLLSFLEANGIAVVQEGAAADLSVADVADRARRFTVRIECLQ